MSRPALLLCTDMDRTLLPNGHAPESPHARPLLARLVERDDIRLAYVTGRDRGLVEAAIAEYALPRPDHVIGDVGTSIYSIVQDDWQSWQGWHDEIGHSWRGLSHDELHACLAGIDELRLQEATKQGRYKLSYYAPGDVDAAGLQREVATRLARLDIDCDVVWSVDETRDQGLLDILPAAASKYHAVEFLLRHSDSDANNMLYAGDSGNDLDVLCSPLPAVLVANASTTVRREAEQLALQRGQRKALYLARGGYLGMNGNYAAGILEGVAHYYPDLARVLEEIHGAD